MVGRWVSFKLWEDLFSGAMLVSGSVMINDNPPTQVSKCSNHQHFYDVCSRGSFKQPVFGEGTFRHVSLNSFFFGFLPGCINSISSLRSSTPWPCTWQKMWRWIWNCQHSIPPLFSKYRLLASCWSVQQWIASSRLGESHQILSWICVHVCSIT